MLYEIFWYMVFTRYSAGEIWSSICITIYLTRFLYQICVIDESDKNNYLYV